ncbi:receptor-type tyrosine-protein phosphatase eta-like isoform X4 [Melanotaenia boesemani]|uniref:receptor-type tyrosine-protein phosphatase eta-like isoform X4 n=1 Tax=Melanotaenia boesemani TaxID=1250792 RepID=UPI001C03EF43|nr:receptor-type tyrosine-protein phosphatase eta-like isoform X4 [Melanotaenia boesemani]
METFSRSQILQELNLRCHTLAAKGKRGFKQEFGELNEVGKDLSIKAGELEANREKNRYPLILPYDHCRVRLSIQSQNPYSDYINANFVPGGGSERDFICTQGPLPNTIADFWRMVWEQNVKIIIMVTALKYKNTVLCDKYWSLEQGTVYHGLFQVTTVTCKQGPDYFITTINLRQRDSPTDRIITHYHYLSWPDQGVPNLSSLCVFTEHVRQHLEEIPRLGPAVVHCRRRPVRDICDFAVADAAVCEGNPTRHQSCCGRPATASNVDGPESGAVCVYLSMSGTLAQQGSVSKATGHRNQFECQATH